MKVVIDHSLCEGHAKCMDTAPEVFEVRDDDRSYALVAVVPAQALERVQRAVQICPRAAIRLEDPAG